jgi:hypothetical protein
MSAKGKIILISVVGVTLIGLTLFLTAVGWYNEAVSLETSTQAQYRDNQNEYDAFWKKVKEVAQVPSRYKEDFKDLLVSETTAKFGEGGSKATFQWFKDREIKFDSDQYKKIQNVIESGRDDFKRAQTILLDKQRKYNLHLNNFSGKLWAGKWGMPKVVSGELAPRSDLDGDGFLTVLDYPIVTSKRTAKAFAEGEDEALDVFN